MACNITTKSGQCKGLENVMNSSIKGKLQGRKIFINIMQMTLAY